MFLQFMAPQFAMLLPRKTDGRYQDHTKKPSNLKKNRHAQFPQGLRVQEGGKARGLVSIWLLYVASGQEGRSSSYVLALVLAIRSSISSCITAAACHGVRPWLWLSVIRFRDGFGLKFLPLVLFGR